MKRIFVILFLVASIATFGQSKDIELWTGGEFKVKFNKKWSASIAEQLRFNNNVSNLRQAFTELSGKYKFNKYFALSTTYRYIGRPNSNNKNRFSLDFLAKYKLKEIPLSFGYRLRAQKAITSVSKNTTSYIRNKFSVNYNLSKLVDPFIAYETYFMLKKSEFRLNRITIGLDWKINKQMSICSYYRFQKETNVKFPARTHIIGLLFAYKIGWKNLTKTKEASSL